MIDPVHITDYNRSSLELEELLLFCIAVAASNALRTATQLDKFLKMLPRMKNGESHFTAIRRYGTDHDLPDTLRRFGIRFHTSKARGFMEAANADLDLHRCDVQDLEKINGIGMKTSRFFVLHTRKNAQVACLDVHILRWLKSYCGVQVPSQTPAKKKYLELEEIFLEAAKALRMQPADLDLKIWNRERELHNPSHK